MDNLEQTIFDANTCTACEECASNIAKAVRDMVPPLVWQRNGNHYAGGYGYVIRKQGHRFALSRRNLHYRYFDTLDEAQSAAETHHREAVAQMAGWV